MPNTSIVVFGEALVDLFKNAAVAGGAPFNVARHLAGFGQRPLFISAIGQDNAGDLIQQELSRFHLTVSGVQVLDDKRTGFVQVHEAKDSHIFEIMPDCAYDFIDSAMALKSVSSLKNNRQRKMLYHGTLCLRANNSNRAFQSVSYLVANCSQSKIFCDINWREGHVEQFVAMQCLRDADIIKLSIEELQMVLMWFKVVIKCEKKLPWQGVVERSIQLLMTKFKSHLLLVTYGDIGSAAFDQDGLCIACAPSTDCPSVVDTVGAGDAFSSVMLLAFTEQWPIGLALRRANQFASDICSIRGATPTELTFYHKYIEAWAKKITN